MWLDEYREVMYSNVYDIPQRIREIDPDYFIVRNHNTKQFEVHHSKQIGGTLALNIPYDELDERTLIHTQKTMIENAKQIYEEMEKQNEKLKRYKRQRMKDKSDTIVKDIHKYVTRHESKETVPDDAFTTREV